MQSQITSILGLVSHTSSSNFLLEVPFEFQYTDRMKIKNIEVDSLDIWMGALVVFGLASVGFIIWLGITLSKL